jgi:CheY-like chemotaxis protein
MQRILIVDDEPGFQFLLEIILRRAGYETLLADNGNEALQMVYRYRPHAIILDDDMPGLRGSEICRRIKNDPEVRHIPTIMHSAAIRFLKNSDREKTRADAFLPKPSLPREILNTIDLLLRAAAV